MSDRIAVMSEGRVEQIGTPEEIYHEPDDGVRRRVHRHGEPAARHVIERPRRRPRGRHGRRRPRSCARRRSTASTAGEPATLDDPARAHAPPVDEPAGGARVGARPRSSTSCSRARSSASTCAAPDGSAVVAHVGPEDDLPLLRPGDRCGSRWEPESRPAPAPRASTSRSTRTRRAPRSKSCKRRDHEEPIMSNRDDRIRRQQARARRRLGHVPPPVPRADRRRCSAASRVAPAVLAACGGERQRQRRLGRRRRWRRASRVAISNWTSYMDPALKKSFPKDTGHRRSPTTRTSTPTTSTSPRSARTSARSRASAATGSCSPTGWRTGSSTR